MMANHAQNSTSGEDDLARLDAMIAERTAELRRLAALARASKAPVLTREEIEFATALGREAAGLRRTG
jgi:hypothetical protein